MWISGMRNRRLRTDFPAIKREGELTATCDLIEEGAKLAKKRFGAERHYRDYDEMLEDPEVEAVFITTGMVSSICPKSGHGVEDYCSKVGQLALIVRLCDETCVHEFPKPVVLLDAQAYLAMGRRCAFEWEKLCFLLGIR